MPRPSRRPPFALAVALAVALAATLSVALGATAVPGPPQAAEAAVSCPKPKSTVASKGGTRAWVSADALRVCVKRGSRTRIRTFGPWSRKSRIRLDDGSVVWTTRTTRGGKPVDRLWARRTDGSPRWMGGLRAAPRGTPKDERLRTLVTGTEVGETGDIAAPAAAWVTRSGAVVVARSADVEGPGDEPRTLITRLPKEQIAAVAGTLEVTTQTSIDESCVSATTNVVVARRTAGGPLVVLDEGTTRQNDDPPGDTTCEPGTSFDRTGTLR